ncbi:hypothetical protein [Pseudomonas putida]
MSQLHSQAGNFLDFMKTGVDARTGQFTLAISLPLPPANALCGPALPITLTFSLLSSMVNRGYGLGWSLGLSELNLNQGVARLSLASGEQFAVDLDASSLSEGGQLVFADQRLNNVQATLQPDGRYRIERKSGNSEFLRQQADSARYLLEEIRSPEGRRLFVDWLPFADGDFILEQIRDESRTLLVLDSANDELHFTLNPQTALAATLRAQLSNDRLTHLYLPGVEPPVEIDYQALPLPSDRQLLLPSRFKSPLGAYDIVHWATEDQGHRLPEGAPFDFLPRVASWTHASGSKACELNRNYTWLGEHNFFGYGSAQAFEWHSGRDNLYQVEHDYRYEVIETQTDGNGRALGSIQRTWNRFHLLTREVSRKGNCETRKLTCYGIDPTLTWEQQPAGCQLPHQVCITYADLSREGVNRSEITTYHYDDFGNLTYARYPSGVQERSDYYPATGAEGCPADTLGMVRHLQRKTIIPAPGAGQAPTLSCVYTYLALPSLIAGDPAHTVVAQEQGIDEQDGRELESTRHSYVLEPGAGYGRLQASVTTLNGKATSTEYLYRYQDDELIVETKTIGFENDDENRSCVSSAQSTLTGLTSWERDQAGTLARYQYDLLGRIVRTLNAAGSPFQTERLARYHVYDALAREASNGDSARNPAMLEQVDITGRRQRQWLDGEGRPVRLELEDLDHAPGQFKQVQSTEFDALGRQTRKTSLDWFTDEDTPALTLTQTTAYDDWGHATLGISPDGLQTRDIRDPIEMRSTQWQQAGELAGPRQVVLSNSAGSPIEQQDFDDRGRLVRTTRLVRDGLDRLIEKRIETPGGIARVTRWRLDHYGRIVEQQLQDGTTLAWSFAPHSDGQHPEAITLTPPPTEVP